MTTSTLRRSGGHLGHPDGAGVPGRAALVLLMAISAAGAVGMRAAEPPVGPAPASAPAPTEATSAEPPTADGAANDERPTRQEMQDEEEALRKAAGEITAQSKRIRDELRAPGWQAKLPEKHWAREWAGEYYVGDGLGMNVAMVLAPQGGITYTWHGCMGLYDGNLGQVEGVIDEDGDGRAEGLKIKWTLQRKSGYRYNSANLYFVRWAGDNGGPGRRYLVPEAQMMSIVNDYNRGSYARDALYSAPMKREGELDQKRWERAAVRGVPQLPARWAKLLILKRIEARVTSVAPSKVGPVTTGVEVTRARVVLDKGRADGLYAGLEIEAGGLSLGAGILTIEKLEDHSAEGTFQAFAGPGQKTAVPEVGQTLLVAAGVEGVDQGKVGESGKDKKEK